MQDSDWNNISLSDPDDEAVRALLPGYALGIATPEEAELVEALLARHPELAGELAAYRRLTSTLAADTPPVAPPEGAFDALMRRIEAEAPPEPPTLGTRLAAIFLAPRLRLSPAVAALLVVLVAGVIGLLGAEVGRLREAYDGLLRQRDEQELALTLMRARDVRWVQMQHPQEPAGSPSFAWLVYSPDEQSGVVLANSFPPLEPNMAYQLWATGADERISLGLFSVDDEGAGAITFRLPEQITAFESMGITPEPSTGSPGPTSPPVVRLILDELNERLTATDA